MSDNDLFKAMLPVVECLEALGVAHYVGGSVASSAFGLPRSTMGVDIVAELEPWHLNPFIEAVEDLYYTSRPMIESAIDSQSSFNLIHHATSFKVDIFAVTNRPYDQECLRRIQRGPLGASDDDLNAWLPTPEDVVLAKLEWYRKGGRISERQWLDVQGVMKVQRQLDLSYMRKWATELQLAQLLAEALAEAGIDDPPDDRA